MSSAGCLRLKSPKSTNYCQVTGSLLPRTPAELPFLFTGTIETKRSVTTLPCDTHERRRTIVFVAISLRHPACVSGLTLTFIACRRVFRSCPPPLLLKNVVSTGQEFTGGFQSDDSLVIARA